MGGGGNGGFGRGTGRCVDIVREGLIPASIAITES